MLEDYGIKKYGDHYVSYHKATGKILYHGATWSECYADLLEEFGEER